MIKVHYILYKFVQREKGSLFEYLSSLTSGQIKQLPSIETMNEGYMMFREEI